MAISGVWEGVTYICDNATVFFEIPDEYLDPSHIKVTWYDLSDNAFRQLVYGTDYTIANDEVETVLTYPIGDKIIISLDMPFTQEVDLQEQGRISADTLDYVHDKLTLISQQLRLDNSSSIRLAVPETPEPSLYLPDVASRADRLLGFDTDGNVTATAPYEPGTLSVTAWAEDFLLEPDAPGARAYMNVYSIDETSPTLQSNTTVNLNSSMTTAQIQALIDAQPIDLNGFTLTFQFADGTYSITSNLTVNNFFGGPVLIQGNPANNTLSATKSVVLNFADGIVFNATRNTHILLKYLKVNSSAYTTALYSLKFNLNNVGQLDYCSLLGSSASYGLYVGASGKFIAQYNYYDTFNRSITVATANVRSAYSGHYNCTDIYNDAGWLNFTDSPTPTNYNQGNNGAISIAAGVFNEDFPFGSSPVSAKSLEAELDPVIDDLTWDIASTKIRNTTVISNSNGAIQSVMYVQALNIFVSVGQGTAYGSQTSPNGRTWAAVAILAGEINGIAYSPSIPRLVGVGSAASNNLIYGTNGTSWTQATITDGDLNSVVWSPTNNLFVAVGSAASNNVQYSSTGISWTNVTVPNGALRCVRWIPETGLFVAVGSAATNNVQWSSNGSSWNQATTTNNGDLRSIAYSPKLGRYVAVGNAATNNVQWSTNLSTWNSITVPDGDLNDVIWIPELSIFVAVGSSASNNIQFSSDGLTWYPITSTALSMKSVTWSRELSTIVMVGSSGTLNCAYSL